MTEVNHRKVFAAGYFEGLRDAGVSTNGESLKEIKMHLSKAKFDRQYMSINSVLKKVYEATPINEYKTAISISAEMRRLGTGGADSRQTLGCLNSLMEMGLVEEFGKGEFRRVEVKSPQQKQIEQPETKEEKMSLPAKVVEIKPEVKQENASPIDRLSKFANRLRDLANDMENAAIELAEAAEKNEIETAKMRQLQQLLKSLG